MDEEMIERSPEAMNDPENVVFKREKNEKFIRTYDEIKNKLDEIKNINEELNATSDIDLDMDGIIQRYKAAIVVDVLDWVLGKDINNLGERVTK